MVVAEFLFAWFPFAAETFALFSALPVSISFFPVKLIVVWIGWQ